MKNGALVTLGVAMFIMALGSGLTLPLIPVFAENLGATGFWIGLIFGVNPLMRGIMMPVFGRMADVRGKKLMLLFGIGGNALAGLAFALSSAPWHLFVTRVGQGMVTAAVIPVAMAYAGGLSAKGTEGSVMGLFTISFMTGFGTGPIIGGWLAHTMGMSTPFYLMAATSLLALALVWILVPEQAAPDQATVPAPLSLGNIMSHRPVRGLIYARGLSAMAMGISFAVLPLYADRFLGMDSARVGAIITVQIMGAAPFQPLFGRLADRSDRVRLGMLGLIIGPIGFLMIPLASGFAELVAISMLLALGNAIFFPATTAIAVNMGRGMGMGSLMGLMEMAMGLGMALGSLSAGALADVWSLAHVIRLAGVMGLGGALVFAVLSRPRAAQEAVSRAG